MSLLCYDGIYGSDVAIAAGGVFLAVRVGDVDVRQVKGAYAIVIACLDYDIRSLDRGLVLTEGRFRVGVDRRDIG